MKKRVNILLAFLLVFAVLFSACSKQDESSEDMVNNSDEIAEELEQEGLGIEEELTEEEESAVEEEPASEEEMEEESATDEKSAVDKKTKKEETQPAKAQGEKPKAGEKTVDQRKNTLKIQGKVSNELSLSLAELQAYTDIGYSGTFYSLNNFGTTQHTDFKGVNLWLLLKNKAGISDSAATVKIIAVDGYEMQFTIAQIKRSDYIDETDQNVKLPVIIAWQENGENYSINDGPPYKLVIGQKEPGDINKPQWVSNIDRIIVE